METVRVFFKMFFRPNLYYVYILKCNDDTLYTGITNNLERRIRQHNGEIRGGAKYTRNRRPVELVYLKKYPNRKKAMKREWTIKHTLNHQQKLSLVNKVV